MHSTRDPSINGIIPYRQRNTEIYTTENTTIDEWRRYFAASENLQEENNSTVLNLNLALLMGIDLNEFWRYEGSLTTPPCTEGIIWTIFKTPIMFTENELGGFRTDIFPEGYRGPQPLYDRIVYRNFRNETLSSIPDYNCCTKDLKNSANKTFGLVILQLLSYLFLHILKKENESKLDLAHVLAVLFLRLYLNGRTNSIGFLCYISITISRYRSTPFCIRH
jgi:hypothetical protein